MALSREGRDRAFEEIVRRYRAPLVAYAGSVVPRHRAEDVVQVALTKAHGALRRGDSEIQLRPWLYTIVRNTALNDLRDEPRHERINDDFDGMPRPDQIAERREELEQLVRSMRDLPRNQREALLKREMEGRSHEEIAAVLTTSPSAVRGLIFRARRALRDGAGMLIPLPVLRFLVSSGDGAAAGATGAGAGGAALGATLGGGSGATGIKIGVAAVVATLAVGSGVALHERGGPSGDSQGSQVRSAGELGATAGGSSADARGGSGPGGEDRGGRRGSGGEHGTGGSGGGGESSGSDDDHSSGSGGGSEHSGSGGSGSGSEHGGSGGSGGPGGGELEANDSGVSGESETSGSATSSEEGPGGESGGGPGSD